MRRKSDVLLSAVVVAALAAGIYLGVRGALVGSRGDLGDELSRKKAFEEAMKKGDLSLVDAQYWRSAPTAATAAGVP